MTKYMRVEKLNGDAWEEVKMWDLKNKEKFRMFDPDTGEPFVGDDDLTEWVVKGKPHEVEIKGEKVWEVLIED